jgi:hypothetical protein
LDELLFDGPILLNFGIDLAFSALNLIPLPLIHWSFVRLDPQFALFANLISHGTASERERPRSRRRLRPQKLAEYWRKTEGTFDCQASLVFGRGKTSEGGKGTDVRPAGRVHPGEAATEQKQGEVDGKRSAIGVGDERSMIAGWAAVDVYPSPAVRRKGSVDLALP